MSSHDVIRALREDDGAALAAAAPYDDSVASAIQAALQDLDVRGRLMSTWVLGRATGAARASVLLDMTGDPVERVGAAAARELLGLAPAAMPPADRLVYAVPVRLKPSVRSLLYRAVAMKGDASVLDLLRGIFDQERDEAALLDAHVAAARLGGEPERAALHERIAGAPLDEVPRVFEHLVFVGDAALAPALLRWFDDERVAKVMGNHFRRTLVRVVDFAAVAASRLGVAFDHAAPLALTRSPVASSVVAAARTAVRAMTARPTASLASPPGPVVAAPPLVITPIAPPPVPQIAAAPILLQRARPSPGWDPGTAPLPAKPAMASGEPMTKPLVLPQAAPSTPFVAARGGVPFAAPATPSKPSTPTPAAPRQRPRIPTGTLDLESALAAEKAAESSRPEARSTSSPPPRGPQLTVEQYAWLCALVEQRPDQKVEAWRRFGIPDEAGWNQLRAAWQPWLAEDRARVARFHELVAEYRRASVSL